MARMFRTHRWQVAAGLFLTVGVIASAQQNEITRGTEVSVVKKTMKATGATLYYEVRGSGPVLLMIPGGPADADVFGGIAPVLAEQYTVVTYDPRGNSRSQLDGTPEAWRAEIHADDASLLLAAVGTEPAYVFGSSSGALVGIALATRHPNRVHTLVAHEPPTTALLPDRERHRAASQEVYDVYKREGAGPAMAKFLAHAGLAGDPRPPAGPPASPGPELTAMMARMAKNIDLFLAYTLRQVGEWAPDIAALEASPVRVVVAAGEASRGQLASETAVALAERLGTNVVYFPGDHGGFGSDPAAFAEKIDSVLRRTESAIGGGVRK
jgi:pimeloyl-ACP methyl ester carboxylesterase